MEIFRTYPIQFFFVVILPLVAGIATAYIGYDNLKVRLGNAKHNAWVESSLRQVQTGVDNIGRNEQILKRYEKTLQAYDVKDSTLAAVLAQYDRQRHAAEQFFGLSGKTASRETEGLAEEVISILKDDIMRIRVDERLPWHPLIIRFANNAFRVLFSVPARIPPRAIEFTGLPEGITSEVHEVSKFGFTVFFHPATIPVDNFGFIADAEL